MQCYRQKGLAKKQSIYMSDANADDVTKMLNQKIDKIVVNVVPEIFSRGDAKLTFKRSIFSQPISFR